MIVNTWVLTVNFMFLTLFKASTCDHLQIGPNYSSYNGSHAVPGFKIAATAIPYQVLIAYQTLYCSGALILSKIVVTAASCFVKWRGDRVLVKIGSEVVTENGQIIEVLDVKKHEYFGHVTIFDNDIAILMLREHVKFTKKVQKIVLIEPNSSLPPGTVIEVTGYADQQLQKFTNSLLYSDMTLLSDTDCKDIYPGIITLSNFCAKYSAEHSLRDNGGPAIFDGKLVGILSYGAIARQEPFVAVLTNVSYFHNWIKLNAKRLLMKNCLSPVRNDLYYDPT